jgi:hypothetical protein
MNLLWPRWRQERELRNLRELAKATNPDIGVSPSQYARISPGGRHTPILGRFNVFVPGVVAYGPCTLRAARERIQMLAEAKTPGSGGES